MGLYWLMLQFFLYKAKFVVFVVLLWRLLCDSNKQVDDKSIHETVRYQTFY